MFENVEPIDFVLHVEIWGFIRNNYKLKMDMEIFYKLRKHNSGTEFVLFGLLGPVLEDMALLYLEKRNFSLFMYIFTSVEVLARYSV